MVVFITLLELATPGETVDIGAAALLLLRETGGGLCGGISQALALGLPDKLHPEVFVPMTFAGGLFSSAVQGLTLKPSLSGLSRQVSRACFSKA